MNRNRYHTAIPHVKELLRVIGEDVDREGLADTPARVVKSLLEMTAGYQEDPKEHLKRTFACDSDDVVVVRGIRFASLCEHHLLPFTGSASIAYLPGGRVIGLSKFARLVNGYARRLQIQERLTTQIAEAIAGVDRVQGAAVILRAHHGCMSCRGVMQPESEMITSSMLGVFRKDAAARSEVMRLLGVV